MFKHNTGMQIFIVIAQIVLLLLLPQFVNKCEKLAQWLDFKALGD